MDKLESMRAFVTVAQLGGFTRAAERLDMSPQLVSKYVAQLEQGVGARLLNRTTRRVNLTEAGELYCLRAQLLLDDLEDMENQVSDFQQQARGQLRISAPVSFAIGHMGALLTDFQRAHPAVSIDLQLNDRKVDIVDEGFDIALRIGRLKSSSLIARRVAPVRLVYCASPEYLQRYGEPDSLRDLSEHRLLRYSYMENDDHFPSSPLASGGQLHCNNGEVLTQVALRGGGIVLQPTFLVADGLADGRLRRILPAHEPEPLALYVVYAHRQLLASKVRSFVDFIEGYYGEMPEWDAVL